jgi:hypothetical protein
MCGELLLHLTNPVKAKIEDTETPEVSTFQKSPLLTKQPEPRGAFVSGITIIDGRDHTKMFVADMKWLDGRPILNSIPAYGDRWKDLFDIVVGFEDAHGNNLPTIKWVNKKLKQQRKDFRISTIRRATEQDMGVAVNLSGSKNFKGEDITTEGFSRAIDAQGSEGADMKNLNLKRHQDQGAKPESDTPK